MLSMHFKISTYFKMYHWERTFGSVSNQHFDFNLWGHWLLYLSKEKSGKVTRPSSMIPSPKWTSALARFRQSS